MLTWNGRHFEAIALYQRSSYLQVNYSLAAFTSRQLTRSTKLKTTTHGKHLRYLEVVRESLPEELFLKAHYSANGTQVQSVISPVLLLFHHNLVQDCKDSGECISFNNRRAHNMQPVFIDLFFTGAFSTLLNSFFKSQQLLFATVEDFLNSNKTWMVSFPNPQR